MWYMHDGAGWWMLFGVIFMVIFWGGLIGILVWGINRLTGCGNNPEKLEPLSIVKERYARGEISKEEFEQIKKDLY